MEWINLRDWFAAQAAEDDIRKFRESYIVSGDIVHYGLWGKVRESRVAYKYTREEAKYKYADAMLEARSK